MATVGESTIGIIKIGMAVGLGGLIKGTKQAANIVNKFKYEVIAAGKGFKGIGKGFADGFSGAQKAFDSVMHGINGINSAIGIVTSAFNAMYNVIAKGVNVAKFSIGLVAEAESASAAFEVLTGSARQSQIMIEKINSYAARSTIGGKKNIQDAAKTMLGFGMSVDKVMPSIEAIGEITAGNAERFSSLTLAFAQCQAAGRLMGQDLLQMVNAGFNPLQQISKDTGISIGDLKKKMESGVISSDMITTAFQRATQAGGLFYGMNEKISHTINGMTEMIKSKATLAWTKFSEEVLKAFNFQQTLEQFNSFVDSIIARSGEFTAQVVQYINTYKDTWYEGFKAATEGVKSLIEALRTIGPIVSDLVKWTFDIKGSWKDAFIDMQLTFKTFVTSVKINVLQLQQSLIAMMKIKEKMTNWGGNKNANIMGLNIAEGAVNAEIARLSGELMQIGIDFANQQIKAPEIDWSPWTKKFEQMKKEMPSLLGEESWFAVGKKKLDALFNKTKAFDALKEKATGKQEFIKPFAENDYFHPMGKKPEDKKKSTSENRLAGLAVRGSKEEYDALARRMTGATKDDTAKNTKDTVLALKTTNTLIKKQIDQGSTGSTIEQVSFA
ncbi:MAG: tape measure protein [Planctomycetaceae bacterium]